MIAHNQQIRRLNIEMLQIVSIGQKVQRLGRVGQIPQQLLTRYAGQPLRRGTVSPAAPN